MIFDTDVLIWLLHGNKNAADQINKCSSRNLSIISYMELVQGARNKQEMQIIRKFINDLNFCTLAITENMSNRAAIYMEEYCLQNDLSVADALIAATAVENSETLLAGNNTHFRIVQELAIKQFRP